MRPRPSPRRQQTRWNALELGLIVASLLLLLSAVGGEAFRWLLPPLAPAAARMEAATPVPGTTEPATALASATPLPSATATAAPTELPSATVAPTELPSATVAPTELPSATVAPTELPSATVAPTELPPSTLPLQLEKHTSATHVQAGAVYVYVLDVISTSPHPLDVVVRDSIDGAVDLLAVQSSSGSCSTSNPIDCRVSAARDQPARIGVRVRVRADAAVGSQIVSQAVAQDQQNNAAVSQQVFVTVDPPLQAPTTAAATPLATLVLLGPTPVDAALQPPTPDVYQVDPAQPASATPARRATPSRPTDAPVSPTAATSPTSAPIAVTPSDGPPTAASVDATVEATPPLPPTAALPTIPPEPLFPPTAGPLPDTTAPPLPDTASVPLEIGLAGLLMGLALVIHSTRRVRHASDNLARQGALAGPLAPLLAAAAQLQSSAATEIERMRCQCQQLIELLRDHHER